MDRNVFCNSYYQWNFCLEGFLNCFGSVIPWDVNGRSIRLQGRLCLHTII